MNFLTTIVSMGSKKLDACGIVRMIYEQLEEKPCVYTAYPHCGLAIAKRLSIFNCMDHFSTFACIYEST